MGCSQSKDDGAAANAPPAVEDSSPFNALSPSVALQNLLSRPKFIDVTSDVGKGLHSAIIVGGSQLKETFRMGEKGFREGINQLPRHLRNVFAKPLELLPSLSTMPVYPKSEQEKDYLEEALMKNFVFENMVHRQLFPMVQALEKHQVKAGTQIITQGDAGDYFYILFEGECTFLVDGKKVGTAKKGQTFGELALLYDAPRAATVQAATDCTLFRVDQIVFRQLLKEQAQSREQSKVELLKKVPFLKDLGPHDIERLAEVMRPRTFTAGETLITKGEKTRAFWIIEHGSVKQTDIGGGNIKYEDILVKAGDYLGEKGLISDQPLYANVIAEEDGMAFMIDRETFVRVLGNLEGLIMRCTDRKKLSGIKIIQQTELDTPTLATIAGYISDRKWKAGQKIMVEGKKIEAGLYLLRSGKVRISNKAGTRNEEIGTDGYFGQEQLLTDVIRGSNGHDDPTTCRATYAVDVLEDCICGILWLSVLRNCVDTTMLGKPQASILDSLVTRQIPMSELKKHTILGAGTFGQVWLVSRVKTTGENQAYALKVQSKYELVESGQARAVVEEKNIMAALHSPFIISLVTTYKDDNCVYMLMELVQGGELYGVMNNRGGGMKEGTAKFYIAGIGEGLAYMHRRGICYRDLKPENVLVGNTGYPVIIDFGFAKRVKAKTYTLCGTPLYLAPEVILNRGHNMSADMWSLGVLVYEMLIGYTPFYKSGMDQSTLFKAIVKGTFHMPSKFSPDAVGIVNGLLVRDPSMRLGNLAGGDADVLESPFLRSIDMDKLRKRTIKPPSVPKVKNPLDASNFEDWSHLDDKSKMQFPSLPREQEVIFEKF